MGLAIVQSIVAYFIICSSVTVGVIIAKTTFHDVAHSIVVTVQIEIVCLVLPIGVHRC